MLDWIEIITKSRKDRTLEEKAAAEYISWMMDIFENTLDKFGIKLIEPDVPSEETKTESDDINSEVNLKGSNYDELADRICQHLNKKEKDGTTFIKRTTDFYNLEHIIDMLASDIIEIFREYVEQMTTSDMPDIADYDLTDKARYLTNVLSCWRLNVLLAEW